MGTHIQYSLQHRARLLIFGIRGLDFWSILVLFFLDNCVNLGIDQPLHTLQHFIRIISRARNIDIIIIIQLIVLINLLVNIILINIVLQRVLKITRRLRAVTHLIPLHIKQLLPILKLDLV